MTHQRPSKTCVCGHAATHHNRRRSVPQGLMADYKVIFLCGWTGCGCPEFVADKDAATSESVPSVTDFEAWLDAWFRKQLTYDNTAYRPDDEWSAVLISDMYAAGFTVGKGSS